MRVTMSLFCRYEKLISSIFKNSVLLERKSAFGSVSSLQKARYHNLCLSRQCTRRLCSYKQCHRGVTSNLDTKRCYSDVYSESNLQKCDKESLKVVSDNSALSRGPSETFNLDVLVSLLRQENAVDICVIKLPEQIKYVEYFIVVSGISPRHLHAMALYTIKMYKFLKKDRDPNVKIEGKDAEDWMCIDFGNMVIHFMLPETREAYELEKLWTLRNYDEKLQSIPPELLPEDFIYDGEVTTPDKSH